MPLRPSLFAIPTTLTAQLSKPQCSIPRHNSITPSNRLHTSSPLRADPFPNHYEVLELPPTASTSEIKRQFFALSKRHHPDTSPSPNSLPRFHALNDAYHTLATPDSRARYDRDYARAFPSSSPHPQSRSAYPSGSHSSHTAHNYAGSRPASGLSRRRTQFRGPPPSFYRNGGWGEQGAKRAAKMNSPPEGGGYTSARSREAGAGMGGGFGPGQASHVFASEVPHFDREAHTRTHESILEKQGRRRVRERDLPDDYSGGQSQLGMFVMVSGILLVGVMGSVAIGARGAGQKNNERKEGKA